MTTKTVTIGENVYDVSKLPASLQTGVLMHEELSDDLQKAEIQLMKIKLGISGVLAEIKQIMETVDISDALVKSDNG